MKSSDEFSWTGTLIGLALAALGIRSLAHWTASPWSQEQHRRLGYGRTAATLSEAKLYNDDDGGWIKGFRSAIGIQHATADQLSIVAPGEEELVFLETDVQPAARFGIYDDKMKGLMLWVAPQNKEAWSAPSGSGALVQAAAYPANGRLAYYDLGRIWISDLNGLRMQSLQHVPLLDEGGELHWDWAGTRLCWMGRISGTAAAVELGAMEKFKP